MDQINIKVPPVVCSPPEDNYNEISPPEFFSSPLSCISPNNKRFQQQSAANDTLISVTMEEAIIRTSSPSLHSTKNDVVVHATIAHKIIAELVGTYVIILMGCGSVVVDKRFRLTTIGIAVTWGLVTMVMIYTLGHVSGGHFNPAITVAFAASRKFPWRQVPAYVMSQLMASIMGILTLYAMFEPRVDIRCTLTQYIDPPTTDLEAFAWEFIVSFILMLTISGVATDTRAINELSGVAVGSAVLMNFIIAGNITGASMNPARSIGPAIVTMEFHCLWIYIVSPILGALTACFIYSLVRLPINEKSQDSPKQI